MAAASLRIDQSVKMREVNCRIVIEPAKRPTLAELASKITPENQHPEIGWGRPVGKEVW